MQTVLLFSGSPDANNHTETMLITTLFGQWFRLLINQPLYGKLAHFHSSVYRHLAVAYLRFCLASFSFRSYLVSSYFCLLSVYISVHISRLELFCPAIGWINLLINGNKTAYRRGNTHQFLTMAQLKAKTSYYKYTESHSSALSCTPGVQS